jgi:glutamate formiminotransferase
MKILMCVPNISEGKDLKIVGQVVEQIRSVLQVKVQDVSSDPDHNRSVLTYLGEPEAVLKATQAMAKKTFELIDMTHHHGSHPRMGAVDVVPFIPIRGVETKEAVEIARRFGKFVGQLGVPVYYYEDAAARPERRSLTDIRKGEYEALPEKLKSPEWTPDEGPAVFNPKSGGLVTGARFPLVAFNVNLQRRFSFCPRHRSCPRGPEDGSGFDEPNPLPKDTPAAGFRNDPIRSGPVWGPYRRNRAGRSGSPGSSGRGPEALPPSP